MHPVKRISFILCNPIFEPFPHLFFFAVYYKNVKNNFINYNVMTYVFFFTSPGI